MKIQNRILSLVCTLALFCGMVITAPIAFAEEDQWVEKVPMPTARTSFAATVIDGKIYTASGRSGNSDYIIPVGIYDPGNDTWSTGATSSTTRSSASSTSIEGRFYILGGQSGSYSLKTLEIYDPETNLWTTGTDMPSSRTALMTEVLGGKLYAIGGYYFTPTTPSSAMTALKTVEIYDPSTNSWSSGASLPTARRSAASAVVDGRLYLIGGVTGASGALPRVDIYDPDSNTWTTGKSMPASTDNSVAAVHGSNIYVICYNTKGNTLFIYDTLLNQWAIGPTLPIVASNFQAVVSDNTLYMLGGTSGATYSNRVFALNLPVLNPEEPIPADPPKLSVLLNPTETVQLSVTNNLSDNLTLTWSSTDDAVATVDANGKVTAVAPGTCDIFAENPDGTFKESIPIRVVAGAADLFRLAVHLTPGQAKQLYMTEDPVDTTWTSLDPSVATVSETGQISAVAPGLVIIAATADDETQQIYVRVR